MVRFILLPAIQNNNLHKHGLMITIKELLECGFVCALFKTDLQFKIVSNICSLFITDLLHNARRAIDLFVVVDLINI